MQRRISDQQIQNDHDLLTTFRAETNTKLERVISDLAVLSDTVAKRVTSLEAEKLDKITFDRWMTEEYETQKKDTETRMRRLEGWGFMALGALSFLQLISLLLGIYAYFHR